MSFFGAWDPPKRCLEKTALYTVGGVYRDYYAPNYTVTCGGMFKYEFVANLPASLPEKFFFENRLTFGEVMGKSLVSCYS